MCLIKKYKKKEIMIGQGLSDQTINKNLCRPLPCVKTVLSADVGWLEKALTSVDSAHLEHTRLKKNK